MNNYDRDREGDGFGYRTSDIRTPIRASTLLHAARVGMMAYEKIGAAVQRHKANAASARQDALIKAGAVSGKLQNDRLLNVADYAAAGMHEDFAGPYMGRDETGRFLFFPGDKHVMVTGLAGSQKTVSFSIPNIICSAMGPAPCSTVVVDVKERELTYATRAGRAHLDGIDPLYINPMGVDGLPNCRVNFLGALKEMAEAGHSIIEHAQAISHKFLGADEEGTNAWIQQDAKKILPPVLCHFATRRKKLTPGDMYDFTSSTRDEFLDITKAMQRSRACHGYVRESGKRLHAQYSNKNDPNSFGWVMGKLQTAFELYAPGTILRRSTDDTDADFSELKRRPRAVYIIIPDDFIETIGAFIPHVIDYLIETIAIARGPIRTNFLVEELPALNRIPTIPKTLRLFRSKGIRLMCVAQDREGYSKYKDFGGYKVFEENSICLAWGISDATHLRDLNLKAGKRAELIPGVNAGSGAGADTGGASGAEREVDILPPSVAAKICEGRAILDIPGMGIGIPNRPPYWEIPWLAPYVVNAHENPPPDIF